MIDLTKSAVVNLEEIPLKMTNESSPADLSRQAFARIAREIVQELSLKRKQSCCDLSSGHDEIDSVIASALPLPGCKGGNVVAAELSDGDALAWLMDPGDENSELLISGRV